MLFTSSFLNSGMWQGLVPPQYVFANRKFNSVILDPPDFNSGSWIGAGKVVFDPFLGEFILSARPRKAEGGARGFAVNIYQSKDGETFDLIICLTKEQISKIANININSIEGTQLLRDPLTNNWHLYISVDTGSDFVWGGLIWQTLLLTAPSLQGPWLSEGIVIANDQEYDLLQARDATIDIVDGIWYCIYKAVDKNRLERPALAISSDGITWEKHGFFKFDGYEKFTFLSGTIFGGCKGLMFLGLETTLEDMRLKKPDVKYYDEFMIGHGGGTSSFVGLYIDLKEMELETIFRAPWIPFSDFEHKDHPLLGYSSVVYDHFKNRMLIFLEAIGKESKQVGLNETIERVILYETPLFGVSGNV